MGYMEELEKIKSKADLDFIADQQRECTFCCALIPDTERLCEKCKGALKEDGIDIDGLCAKVQTLVDKEGKLKEIEKL